MTIAAICAFCHGPNPVSISFAVRFPWCSIEIIANLVQFVLDGLVNLGQPSLAVCDATDERRMNPESACYASTQPAKHLDCNNQVA
jgi:hypothetical protein